MVQMCEWSIRYYVMTLVPMSRRREAPAQNARQFVRWSPMRSLMNRTDGTPIE
jgi:hypothetical protein